MKANKFVIEQNDEAVSPVIAVILMVAITVVLAATVYVWVSGFGTSGSIKKFPQLTIKDDSDSLPATAPTTTPDVGTALAVLEHRGGDTVNWDDYTVKIFQDGTDVTTLGADAEVEFSSLATCASPTETLTAAFSVGDKRYICVETETAASDLDDWISGSELKIQIVDENQNTIVYENTVVVE